VAEVAEWLQPGHSRAAFERMDFALKVLHQLAVGELVAPGVEDRVAAFEHVRRLAEEDPQDLAVEACQGIFFRLVLVFDRLRCDLFFGFLGGGLFRLFVRLRFLLNSGFVGGATSASASGAALDSTAAVSASAALMLRLSSTSCAISASS
jgi:hypothetical protein